MVAMNAAGLFLLASLAGNLLQANLLHVCFLNTANLDPETVRQFEKELSDIASSSGVSLSIRQCMPGPAADVRITIQSQSGVEPSALGAAKVLGGRVLPELEVYTAPIGALLAARLPVLMGRAMARVAAHELGHFLTQSSEHSDGVMSEFYSGPRLMAADKRSFRIPLNPASDTAR
jgi:hypothetical protein